MCSFPSRTCSKSAPRTAVDASVYRRKGKHEVGEGGDGAGGEEHFEAIESILTFGAPMEDCILPGQGMQRAGDGCKILNISSVIPSEIQEGADFCGVFGRLDLPDGCQERWIRQEALLCYSMAQVTDLLDGESAFFGAKLEFSVSQSLEDLAEAGKVYFPGGGEHNDVMEVKETRFPVKAGEDAIHEAGEGSGSVAEAEGYLIKLKELATASTERCLFLVPLHDKDLPVSTLEVKVENQRALCNASRR